MGALPRNLNFSKMKLALKWSGKIIMAEVIKSDGWKLRKGRGGQNSRTLSSGSQSVQQETPVIWHRWAEERLDSCHQSRGQKSSASRRSPASGRGEFGTCCHTLHQLRCLEFPPSGGSVPAVQQKVLGNRYCWRSWVFLSFLLYVLTKYKRYCTPPVIVWFASWCLPVK